MAIRPLFYFGTVKKLIVAFASIFTGVTYEDTNGDINQVPLNYSAKEKFYDTINKQIDLDDTRYDTVLPRFGFELVSMQLAPGRHLNPLSQIHEPTQSQNSEAYMFNRVAYDFNFKLYLATRYFEDSLKIAEQIIPYFTPELTLTINDMEDFDMKTNVPFILKNVSYDIDAEGSLTQSRRKIVWEFDFVAKAYLYSNVHQATRIKHAVTNYHNADYDVIFDRLTADVVPETANKGDSYTVVDSIEEVNNYPVRQDVPAPDFNATPTDDFSGQDIFSP